MMELADPQTLPMVNIFANGDNLTTLWNYTSSAFYLGMPVLLIAVALLLINPVLSLVFEAFKKAKGGERDEDEGDDGDW